MSFLNHITPAVKILLLVNIGIFGIEHIIGIKLISLLALRHISSSHFYPYQLVTYLFVHSNIQHLLGNMFSLLTLGPTLEYTLSSRNFIRLYFFAGIGAALLYTGIHYITTKNFEAIYHAYSIAPTPQHFLKYLDYFSPHITNSLQPFTEIFLKDPTNTSYIAESQSVVKQLYHYKINTPTVGASGSIFGLFMAFALLFPNARLYLFLIPFAIKVRYAVLLYGIYEFGATIANNPADNIAHLAHLGGLLYGYIFVQWWTKRSNA